MKIDDSLDLTLVHCVISQKQDSRRFAGSSARSGCLTRYSLLETYMQKS